MTRGATKVTSKPIADDLIQMTFTRPRGVAEARVLVGTPESITGPHGIDDVSSAIDAIREIDWKPNEAVAYIDWIETREKSRGRGYGSRLLDDVIGHLLTKVDAIFLIPVGDDDAESERLANWYARNGFEETGWGSANPVMVRWHRGRRGP